jgi:glycerol uptake facilitator-like aquaporin
MRRSLSGEALGTALLLCLIVGSGIAVQSLSEDAGLQLFIHAGGVGIGLASVIAMLQTVSGAHFNPTVTLGFWRTSSMGGSRPGAYALAQLVGAVIGVALANLSFGEGFCQSPRLRHQPKGAACPLS